MRSDRSTRMVVGAVHIVLIVVLSRLGASSDGGAMVTAAFVVTPRCHNMRGPTCTGPVVSILPLHPLQQHHHHKALPAGSAPYVFQSSAVAGRVWPFLRKLHLTPTKLRRIGRNIASMAHWQDVVILFLVAYGTLPFGRLVWEQWSQRQRQRQRQPEPSSEGTLQASTTASTTVETNNRRRDWQQLKRRQVATLVSGAAKIALTVYVVDVVCVALTTLGFAFPTQWDLPSLYSKTIYSVFFVQHFLKFKTLALCQWYNGTPDTNMDGKVELLNRFITAITLGLFALAWLDWVSVKVGLALKGILALGSVSTLAFTLASQDLVSQFVSGLLLSTSNKVYPGDDVKFGDGTQGTIVKLGWVDTILRGGDNALTSVPNAKLANQKVSNMSRVALSQVQQMLRFHYEDADLLPTALESIKHEIRRDCPRLVDDGTRPFRVFWTGYQEDHLEGMCVEYLGKDSVQEKEAPAVCGRSPPILLTPLLAVFFPACHTHSSVMVDAHFRIPPIG